MKKQKEKIKPMSDEEFAKYVEEKERAGDLKEITKEEWEKSLKKAIKPKKK